ncbi:MAG: 3-deoxy-7-phosphoheptulonate synthase, partial [Dehalococcoidia bacterium]|nr:3-deoxy-7-phosphoheptulonate synthase [Dehalococcoidia bacterium]
MTKGATKEQVDQVVERAHTMGFDVQLNIGAEKVVVAILGSNTGKAPTDVFEVLPGVQTVARIMKPYKLAAREFHPEDTEFKVRGVCIGGKKLAVMAGPCAVESVEQLRETANLVKKVGASVLRGGVFKPRTSPFSFQGLEEEGLKLLAEVKAETGMPVITEVLSIEQLELTTRYADII